LVSQLAIHPAIAAAAVLFIITAYLLKKRARHRFLAHYTAGVMGFSLFITAFPIGLYEVAASGGLQVFPAVLVFHFANFFLAASLIFTQCALGMGMLLFGRHRRLYSVHKRLSKYTLIVVLVQGALGLTVLIGILSFLS